jgi:hypothetical protein
MEYGGKAKRIVAKHSKSMLCIHFIVFDIREGKVLAGKVIFGVKVSFGEQLFRR